MKSSLIVRCAAIFQETLISKKDAALKNDAPKTTAEKKPRKPATPKKTLTLVAQFPAPVAVPSREEIARLAHKYWQERGHVHGNADQDWLRAEQELRGRAS
jgi:hypothetical protein